MAGPPVEVQVRVNTGGSVAGSVSNWKVMSPGIVKLMANCKMGICNICTMAVTIGPIKFHACMEVNKCDIIIPPDEVHNFNIHLFLFYFYENKFVQCTGHTIK